MTHAARALQSHDLSEEGINFQSHTYFFFYYTRAWRASPDEWSAQCRDHLRDNTNIKDDTHHALIHSSSKADMTRMIMIVKWYSGNHEGLKLPDICLTGKEKPRKKHDSGNWSLPGIEPVPLRDRRACYRLLHSLVLTWVTGYIQISSLNVWLWERSK